MGLSSSVVDNPSTRYCLVIGSVPNQVRSRVGSQMIRVTVASTEIITSFLQK